MKGKLYKNMLLLFSGTVVAQMIPISFLPILTRIYSPEEFGEFSFFLAVTGMLVVIITIRYELAIHLPKSKQEAIKIVNVTLVITLINSLIFGMILFFIMPILNINYDIDLNLITVLLIILSIISTGAYLVFYQYLSRQGEFKILGLNKVIQQIIIGGSSLGLSIFSTKYMLVVGLVIGQGLSTLQLILYTLKHDKDYSFYFRLQDLKIIILKYKEFPIFQLPSQLISTGNYHLITIVFAALFNSTIIGLYSLAQRMLRLPMTLIGNAVSDVFRQSISKDINSDGEYRETYIKTLKILTIVSVPLFIMMFIFSPFVFELMFGKEWINAGEFVRYLLPMLFCQFIFSPFNSVYIVFKKQKMEFIWQIAMVGVSILAVIVGYFSIGTAGGIILLYSIVNALGYLISGFITYKLIMTKSDKFNEREDINL